MNLEDMEQPWRALERIRRRASAISFSSNRYELAKEIEAIATEALDEQPKVVRIHEFVFKELLEYSSSMPTGVYGGKRWKRKTADGWILGEYVDDGATDGTLLTRWTPIEIIPRTPVVPFPVNAWHKPSMDDIEVTTDREKETDDATSD